MKLLGEKILRDSGATILKMGKFIVKIPLSISAYREMVIEKKNIKIILKDRHFCNYLPSYKYLYFLHIQISPYLSGDHRSNNFSVFIREYLKYSFEDVRSWKNVFIISLIARDFLSFIKNHLLEKYTFWHTYLNDTKILQSSSHGDFHQDNIFVEKGRIFFIDWVRYSPVSSRDFDLIDFFIFSQEKNKSWIENWKQIYSQDIKDIYDIEIENEHLIIYAVWKIAEELKTLFLRNNLTKNKIKKYVNFLVILEKIIKENREKSLKIIDV